MKYTLFTLDKVLEIRSVSENNINTVGIQETGVAILGKISCKKPQPQRCGG